jgi:hypothetical protein
MLQVLGLGGAVDEYIIEEDKDTPAQEWLEAEIH